MATALQRADINDSTYRNNPYRKNPYYNPFLDNGYNRLLTPGEKAVYMGTPINSLRNPPDVDPAPLLRAWPEK